MGSIKTVKRFHCKICGYITENEEQIKCIEKLGGKCPACQDGNPINWFSKSRNYHIS